MITTVTLNPCIDLTVRVPGLRTGRLNLAAGSRSDVSGKGVNVSIVLRELGLATMCTGISFDGNGAQLEDLLEMHGISRQFAVAHGHIRTNIKVFDEEKREMTEINHPGCPVGAAALDRYFDILSVCAEQSDIVVFSGRIPNGADEGIYRRSIKHIRKLGVKVIVDAEGKPFRQALLQRPYLVKPNAYELETAFRCELSSPEDVVEICREKVLARGVEVACVSMGERGAVIVGWDSAWRAPALELDVRGFQGAGDSMVAGICKGIKEGLGIDGMLRYGVAAASASLLRDGTLLCRRADFERLLPKVAVRRIA